MQTSSSLATGRSATRSTSLPRELSARPFSADDRAGCGDARAVPQRRRFHASVAGLDLFGNVFVEALASGLPIIAYDMPKTRWIIGDDGFFPKRRSAEALAAALWVRA